MKADINADEDMKFIEVADRKTKIDRRLINYVSERIKYHYIENTGDSPLSKTVSPVYKKKRKNTNDSDLK